MVTDLWGVREYFGENNRRGITQKLRQGEHPFSRATHCLYLIQIFIKLHEDIMNSE